MGCIVLKLEYMKFIIIFLLISSVCFGQKKLTKSDTAKANVYTDSVYTVNVLADFRNSMFKELKSPDEYEFLKQQIDKFIDIKRKRWEAYLKENK